MIELSGSLEADALRAVLVFLSRLGRSGRIRITRWPFAGDLDLRDGRVVSASFGAERGLQAFDALMLVPASVEFSFTPCTPPPGDVGFSLAAETVADHLDALEPGRRRIAAALPSLSVSLHMAETAAGREEEAVTLTRRHLDLLLAIGSCSSAGEVLGCRALPSALEALVELIESRLVAVDKPSSRGLPPQPPSTVPAPSRSTVSRSHPLRLSGRRAAWLGVGLFVGISGFAQLPDLMRQFTAASGPQPNLERKTPLAQPPQGAPIPSVEWPVDTRGPFWIAGDGYHLAPHQANQFVAVSPPVSASSKDVALRGRFRKLTGPPGATYGFFIRSQEPDNRDGYSQTGRFLVFAVTDDGRATVRQRVGDSWQDVVSPVRSDSVRIDTQPNDLTILAVGPALTFEVNGTTVSRVVDATPAPGSIGLYADGASAEVLVEQLTIEIP